MLNRLFNRKKRDKDLISKAKRKPLIISVPNHVKIHKFRYIKRPLSSQFYQTKYNKVPNSKLMNLLKLQLTIKSFISKLRLKNLKKHKDLNKPTLKGISIAQNILFIKEIKTNFSFKRIYKLQENIKRFITRPKIQNGISRLTIFPSIKDLKEYDPIVKPRIFFPPSFYKMFITNNPMINRDPIHMPILDYVNLIKINKTNIIEFNAFRIQKQMRKIYNNSRDNHNKIVDYSYKKNVIYLLN